MVKGKFRHATTMVLLKELKRKLNAEEINFFEYAEQKVKLKETLRRNKS